MTAARDGDVGVCHTTNPTFAASVHEIPSMPSRTTGSQSASPHPDASGVSGRSCGKAAAIGATPAGHGGGVVRAPSSITVPTTTATIAVATKNGAISRRRRIDGEAVGGRAIGGGVDGRFTGPAPRGRSVTTSVGRSG